MSFFAVSAAAVALTGATMTVVGFGPTGIIGGSIAAATQSVIGNVTSGSLFATLQSFGMLGGFIGMCLAGVAVPGFLLLL